MGLFMRVFYVLPYRLQPNRGAAHSYISENLKLFHCNWGVTAVISPEPEKENPPSIIKSHGIRAIFFQKRLKILSLSIPDVIMFRSWVSIAYGKALDQIFADLDLKDGDILICEHTFTTDAVLKIVSKRKLNIIVKTIVHNRESRFFFNELGFHLFKINPIKFLFNLRESFAALLYEKRVATNSNCLCISQGIFDYFSGVEDCKAQLFPSYPIPNGRTLKLHKRTDGVLKVGWLANFHSERNLSAFKNLERLGFLCKDFKLIVAGFGSDNLLDSNVQRSGLPIEVKGPIQNLDSFYGEIDVVLNPVNVSDGVQSKIYEAFSFGRVVYGLEKGSGGTGLESVGAVILFDRLENLLINLSRDFLVSRRAVDKHDIDLIKKRFDKQIELVLKMV